MKVGIRKPSYKKSFSAKTKGRATRSIKKLTSPGYGKKGMGAIKNPKKSLYNYAYSRTTTSLYKVSSYKSSAKSSSKSSSYSYKPNKIKSYKSSGSTIKTLSSYSTSYKNSINIKNTSKHTSTYRYNGNIREISANHYYKEDKMEFKQEDGLYIEDVTSCFDMEYSNTIDEKYSPLKLKHDEFEIENIQREKTILDNSKYFNMIEECKDYVVDKESKKEKIRSKKDLSFINKKDKSYSVCGPEFETTKPEGYSEFEGISYLNDEFFYDEHYNSNTSQLYRNLKYHEGNKADFEIKKENDKFHIYAYYEDNDKLNQGHVGFIASDEINSQLSLCSDIKIQIDNIFLGKPRFKIYVKEHEYKVILQYKEELEEKREARKELLESRLENEEVAYQFVTLGVDCENNKCVCDAILNYEKAIEIGYSLPFVYERLFLIYKHRNDYENAIRVISKGIEDLKLICEFCDEKSLDYKIACFEKNLKEAIKKKEINKAKENLSKGKNNNFGFANLLNNFKLALNSKNININENYKLPKPLKYLQSDLLRKEFYTFQQDGYDTYDKISEYGYDAFIYGTFNYSHFCENKKIVDNKKIELFNNKMRNGKNISMDFEFEDRNDCIYINSYFYEKGSIVKCEIGFIDNNEIANELRQYEDIKVFIKSYEYDRIKFSIYVK